MKGLMSVDTNVAESPEYQKIVKILKELEKNELLVRLQGNCISSCELISSMLLHSGIESKIVECYLSIKNNDTNPAKFAFIGYDGLMNNEQVDLHTVVVTKTKIPLLIDVTIPHNILTKNTKYIVGTIIDNENKLAEYFVENIELKYNLKAKVRLPHIHQKSILQRIKEEEFVRERIKTLQIGIIVVGGFAFVNFVLNSIQVILKIIHP